MEKKISLFSLFFLLLLSPFFCQDFLQHSIDKEDFLVLQSLKNDSVDVNWIDFDLSKIKFCKDLPPSFECREGKIISLKIIFKNLQGKIPKQIFSLRNLEYLYPLFLFFFFFFTFFFFLFFFFFLLIFFKIEIFIL